MYKATSPSGLPIYPTLNIYMSPRVSQQRVQKQSIPLCKYTKMITSDIREQNISKVPPRQYLKNFKSLDGMIFNFRDKNFRDSEVGTNIKALICICMYNQGASAIDLTLSGIYNNLPYLQQQGIAAQQLAVVLIQDGILKLVKDRKRRTYAQGKNSMIQFYKKLDKHEGKAKCFLEERLNMILDSIDSLQRKGKGKQVTENKDFPPNIEKNISLLYQNLWDPSITNPEDKKKSFKKKLRIFTAFKHTNGTKLSSHLLFFEGFCRYMKPQFCVLLDVGTKPHPKGLVNLIRGFYYGKNIGGCTGLMSIDSNFKSLEGEENNEQNGQQDRKKTKNQINLCQPFSNCCFSIEKAQQYQYIMAHFLDKNAQSALGFLHVLPGAWSAYRYDALIKTQKYQPNLLERDYFKIILDSNTPQKNYEEANMYLAQDRILSLGIYCQMNSKYTLKYVPNAIAFTDPMKDHKNLMNQRRRWINSSLFAFLYVFRNYYYDVQESKHNCWRKYITLNLSMFLALLSFANSYFTPSIYWFVLYISIYQIEYYKEYVQYIAIIASLLYSFVFLSAVGGSLAGKIWTEKAHYASYMLSGFTVAMYLLVAYNVFFIYLDVTKDGFDLSNFNQISVLIMLGINVFCMIFVISMHIPTHCKFVWKLIVDQISYMMYVGAYSQTMVIHGFCNVDDVSWGTKGASKDSKQSPFYFQKVSFVSSWLFWNCIMAFIFLYVDIVVPQRDNKNGGKVLLGLGIYSTSILLIKTILAIYNHFKWLCFERCCNSIRVEKNRKDKVKYYMDKMDEKYIIEQEQNIAKS